jgi:hypothetical protein
VKTVGSYLKEDWVAERSKEQKELQQQKETQKDTGLKTKKEC